MLPRSLILGSAVFGLVTLAVALAQTPAAPRPDVKPSAPAGPATGDLRVTRTAIPFEQLAARIEKAVTANNMGLPYVASPSKSAQARGVKIAGNMVFFVFKNEFSVRVLEANVAAGIDIPLRLYLVENPDGTGTLSYYTAAAVFRRYEDSALGRLAEEIDPILEKIVGDAIKN